MTEIEELQRQIESLESRVARLETLADDDPDSLAPEADLRSLSESFDPSTHPERALVIGYYLEEVEGQDGFTTPDIRDGFRDCRMNLPANMSDVLGACDERDWFVSYEEEGQTQLRHITPEGIEYVEEVLQNGD